MQRFEKTKGRKEQLRKISRLVKKGNFVAEVHMHTTNSDGSATVKQVIDFARSIGIHLAITDHNTIVDFSTLSAEEKKWIIPAIEVTSNEFIDVLCYFRRSNELERFFEKEVKGKNIGAFRTSIPINTLLKNLKGYDCVVHMAHINSPSDHRLNFRRAIEQNLITQENLKNIHTVEAFNSFHDTDRFEENYALANKLGKKVMVGSDAHTLDSIGNAVVYTKAENTAEFLKQMPKGVQMMGCKTGMGGKISPALRQMFMHLRRMLKPKR